VIPKFIHFVWGLGGDEFGLAEYVAVASAARHNPDWEVYVWAPNSHAPSGDWWARARARFGAIYRELPNLGDFTQAWGTKVPHYAHRADLFRHAITYALGGAYLDMDTLTLKPFETIGLDAPFIIGREFHKDGTTEGLCNAIFFCAPFSRFAFDWLKAWQEFDGTGWNEFSVKLPWQMAITHGSTRGRILPSPQGSGQIKTVDRAILGPLWWDREAYWERNDDLPDVTIAHLWRTSGSGDRLKALTVEEIMRAECFYTRKAKEYLA
jgi:hypothetical protein